jgi:hypothetical protein
VTVAGRQLKLSTLDKERHMTDKMRTTAKFIFFESCMFGTSNALIVLSEEYDLCRAPVG